MTLTELRQKARALEDELAHAEAAENQRLAAVASAAVGAVGGCVPPVWFERPRRAPRGQPGRRDAYFHRAQWDWDREIAEGFTGWIKVNGRGNVLLHFASAVAWFEEKLHVEKALREEAV